MEIKNTQEMNTVVIRLTTPVEKLPDVMGSSYQKIMEYLGPKGIYPSGPPFAVYHNMDMSALDVEIGFPVGSPVEGSGDVKPGKLTACKAAVGMHIGPYSEIEKAYNNLSAFVKEQGLEMNDAYCYEFYLNDPSETPPEELKTEIYFPLKQS